MGSFEQLLTVSDRNGKPFDRIVLENSGIAEPGNIRDKFSESVDLGNPLMKRIHLSTLVRVGIKGLGRKGRGGRVGAGIRRRCGTG